MTLVSVIIPCYNLGQYLCDAVDSVLSQTHKNIEIIIVNDGSTDPYTNELLSNFSKPNTIVLTTANQGLPAARNYGISAAKGDFVCCLDSDDMYHPEFIRKSVQVMSDDQAGKLGFVTTWAQFIGDSSVIWKTDNYEPYKLAVENVIHVASLFRKSCWKMVGGYNVKFTGYADWNFWVSIVSKGYQWVCIPEALFYYRVRSNSMVTKSDANRIELYHLLVTENKEFYLANCQNILVGAINQLKTKTYEQKRLFDELTTTIEQQTKMIDERDFYVKKLEGEVVDIKYKYQELYKVAYSPWHILSIIKHNIRAVINRMLK